MVESRRVPNTEQYVATYVNVTCVTSTRKIHITGVSADVALMYDSDGNYVDITSGYA